jgi:GalNAc5-diNAcBac-PP-undecaprenol beta-1,3-glucosyltransferase
MERNNNPKVSVIIPTIGRESLIEALESVLNQTYKNLEIIITDDTEDGRARAKIEKYLTDSRIKYVINTKYKHGPAGNKNNGLDQITGEYFTFLDDDDVLFLNAIEELLNCALKGNYGIVFANCIDNVKKEFTGRHYGKNEEVPYKDMLCGKYEGEYFGINKTSLLGKDRFNEECWGGESLLWMKLWKRAEKGFYLHKSLRIYSVTTPDAVSKFYIQKAKRVYLNYVLFLEEFGKEIIEECPKVFIRHSLMGIYFSRLAGKYNEVIKLCFRSVKAYPKLFVFPLFWTIFCLGMPKFLVIKTYENFLRKFKEKIKKFLSKK